MKATSDSERAIPVSTHQPERSGAAIAQPEWPDFGGARETNRPSRIASEREEFSETERLGEIEADPYEVADQVFWYRVSQLQYAGQLSRPEDEGTEEGYQFYVRELVKLRRKVYQEMGLLWLPLEEG